MSSSSSSPGPRPPSAPIVATVTGKMPNMARTLLLNKSGESQLVNSFAHEYVPPYYRAVTLPTGLMTIRRALFGSNPDFAGLNYSVWQYMRILHSTEYEEWVYDLDPRITYLGKKSIVDTEFGPSVDENGEALQFAGAPGLGSMEGRLYESWSIEQLAPALYRITNLRTRRSEDHVVSLTDGFTNFMPMTGHRDFIVRIQTALATVTKWTVQYLAAPTAQMDPVNRAAQASNIGIEAYNELFPSRDPYKLFKQLWEQHSLFPYKMSGYLLALIYRTEEIRVAG